MCCLRVYERWIQFEVLNYSESQAKSIINVISWQQKLQKKFDRHFWLFRYRFEHRSSFPQKHNNVETCHLALYAHISRTKCRYDLELCLFFQLYFSWSAHNWHVCCKLTKFTTSALILVLLNNVGGDRWGWNFSTPNGELLGVALGLIVSWTVFRFSKYRYKNFVTSICRFIVLMYLSIQRNGLPAKNMYVCSTYATYRCFRSCIYVIK